MASRCGRTCALCGVGQDDAEGGDSSWRALADGAPGRAEPDLEWMCESCIRERLPAVAATLQRAWWQ